MSTEHAVVVGAGMAEWQPPFAYVRVDIEYHRSERAGRRPFIARAFGLMAARLSSPHRTSSTSFPVGRDEDYYEMQPADPFYRVKFDDGEMFDYVGDEERILSQIEQLSPGSRWLPQACGTLSGNLRYRQPNWRMCHSIQLAR